jgi:hypothetical protein
MDNYIVRSEDYLEKKADLLDALKFREEWNTALICLLDYPGNNLPRDGDPLALPFLVVVVVFFFFLNY